MKKFIVLMALIVLGVLQSPATPAHAGDFNCPASILYLTQVRSTTLGTDDGSAYTGADNIPWANPNYITVGGDGLSATAFMSDLITYPRKVEYSHWLLSWVYHFTIPSNATILGVCVKIRKHNTQGPSGATIYTKDHLVLLMVGGNGGGINHADGQWTTGWQDDWYGAYNDTWGWALTPALVNAGNFGVLLQATGANPDPPGDTLYVDYEEIWITYQNNE